MRDFNFFEPYIQVQTKPKRNLILMAILAALLLALLVYYQFLLNQRVNELNGDIAEVNAFIESPTTISKIGEIDEKQTRLDNLQTVYADVTVFTESIKASEKIDDMMIEQINAQLPINTFLTELGMTDQMLNIKGYSLEFKQIAQFAYNLRSNGNFADVLIPTINENNGNYDFTLTVVIDEEVANEN